MTDNPQPAPPILFPLTLYAHEAEALARGALRRLIRYEAPSHAPDRTDIVYQYGDALFRLVKPWRCHKPDVVDTLDWEGLNEPLTEDQLAEAGTTREAFTRWYQGVLERQAAFQPLTVEFMPPDVWLATLERIE